MSNRKLLKDLLTPIRDLILKSRPAYRDYLGEVTTTTTETLIEGTFPSESDTDAQSMPVATHGTSANNYTDLFIVGETYQVTIDGVTYDVKPKGKELYGMYALTNIIDLSVEPDYDYWGILGVTNLSTGEREFEYAATGQYAGKPFSVTHTKTVTEKKYDTKLLPEELLPKTVAKKSDIQKLKSSVQSDVASVQSDVASVQSDVASVQSDVASVQSDVASVQSAALGLYLRFSTRFDVGMTLLDPKLSANLVLIAGATLSGDRVGPYISYDKGQTVYRSGAALNKPIKYIGVNDTMGVFCAKQRIGILTEGEVTRFMSVENMPSYYVCSDPIFFKGTWYACISNTEASNRKCMIFKKNGTYTWSLVTELSSSATSADFTLSIADDYLIAMDSYAYWYTTDGSTWTGGRLPIPDWQRISSDSGSYYNYDKVTTIEYVHDRFFVSGRTGGKWQHYWSKPNDIANFEFLPVVSGHEAEFTHEVTSRCYSHDNYVLSSPDAGCKRVLVCKNSSYPLWNSSWLTSTAGSLDKVFNLAYYNNTLLAASNTGLYLMRNDDNWDRIVDLKSSQVGYSNGTIIVAGYDGLYVSIDDLNFIRLLAGDFYLAKIMINDDTCVVWRDGKVGGNAFVYVFTGLLAIKNARYAIENIKPLTLTGAVNATYDGRTSVSVEIPSFDFVIPSSTEGSTKQFKIIVDDSGTISATEVTN